MAFSDFVTKPMSIGFNFTVLYLCPCSYVLSRNMSSTVCNIFNYCNYIYTPLMEISHAVVEASVFCFFCLFFLNKVYVCMYVVSKRSIG